MYSGSDSETEVIDKAEELETAPAAKSSKKDKKKKKKGDDW